MRKVWAFLIVTTAVCVCLIFPAPAEANSSIPVNTFRLHNGLKVILAPMENVDAVCVMFYHLNGVRDDPPDVRGASYLYETLMLSGTQNLDPRERMFFVKRNGGSTTNMVDYDHSVFCQLVPDSEVNNTLWFESERINSLQLEDSHINRLKELIYNRFSRLNDNNAHFSANNWVRSRVFEGTVYETPIYGDLRMITGFNNRKIKSLYSKFRNLEDIIVVISGKFNIEEVKETLNQRFSGIGTPGRERKRNYIEAEPRTTYIYENRTVSGLPQPFTIYGIRAPSKLSLEHLYFDFLRYYLVDRRTSRLERMFNQRNDLDVSINYDYTDYIEANALIIELSTRERLDLEKAKYVLTKELNALTGNPVSNTDLKMLKTMMEIDFKKDMRDLKRRGFLLAENYHLYGTIDFEEKYLSRIRKTTSYDLMRIAQKYLKKENLVVLNVYNKD